MGAEVLDNWEEIFKRLVKRSRIDPITRCWLWEGALNNVTYGHGIMKLWKHSPKFYVHRLSAYIHLDYDLNSDLQVNHHCSNPHCWNPIHLYIGSQQQNMQDRSRSITHCKHGHEFTLENTRFERHKRHCRECQRIANQRKEPVQLELPFDE